MIPGATALPCYHPHDLLPGEAVKLYFQKGEDICLLSVVAAQPKRNCEWVAVFNTYGEALAAAEAMGLIGHPTNLQLRQTEPKDDGEFTHTMSVLVNPKAIVGRWHRIPAGIS